MTSVLASDTCSATLILSPYAGGFEGGLDGWASVTGAIVAAVDITTVRTGSASLGVRRPGNSESTNVDARRTFTNLVAGRSYRFSAWGRLGTAPSSSGTLRVLASTGDLSGSVTASTTWQNLQLTFVPTSDTATVTLRFVSSSFNGTDAQPNVNWDDVSLVDLGTPLPLQVKGYSLSLDEAHIPYADGTLTVVIPTDPAQLALIDPTANRRVVVTLSKTGVSPALATATRTFDLRLRSATQNAENAELTLGLSSDECALLISGKVATTVDSTYAQQTDLRTLVGTFLSAAGYSLSAGTVTADVTRTYNLTNQWPGGNMEGDAGWGVTGGLNIAFSTDTSGSNWPINGTRSLKLAADGSGNTDNAVYLTGQDSGGIRMGMQAGKTYTATVQYWNGNMSGTTTPNRARKIVVFVTAPSLGGQVEYYSNQASATVQTRTRLSVTFTVPADATGAFIRLYHGMAGGTAYVDSAMLYEGPDIGANNYFDGTYNLDATHYAVAWTGAAGSTTSTRTRLDSRSPDNLYRKPGTTAWEWINTIVQAAGLRLFADEQRVWRLVGNDYAVDGSITVAQAVNLTRGNDTIDIGAAYSGENGYVEAVVVRYSWIDSTGVAQERYDAAGIDGGIVKVLELSAPYPGPGFAAAALARLQGRKRTLDLGGLTNLATTPGMDVATTLPTSNQVGKVSSVTFTDRDEMTVGTRGLVQTAANAWIFAAGAWSAATGSWSAATGTN